MMSSQQHQQNLQRKHVLHVEGMMCQKSCGSSVYNAITQLPGVTSAEVSFPRACAIVYGSCQLSDIIEAVEGIGFLAQPIQQTEPFCQLEVTGMMCQNSCGTTVQNALCDVEGVLWAEANHPSKIVKVWGNADINILISAIENVGFDAVARASDDLEERGEPDLLLYPKKKIDVSSDLPNLQNLLDTVDGVLSIDFDVKTHTLKIWGFADQDAVLNTLYTHGYVCELSPPQDIREEFFEKKNISLQVKGITSVAAAKMVETALYRNECVIAARIAVLTNRIDITYYPKYENIIDTLINTIKAVGYDAEILINSENVNRFKRELAFSVSGMSCANCSLKVEKALKIMPGVKSAAVSCITNRAVVEIDDTVNDAVGIRTILEQIEKLGYNAKYIPSNSVSTDDQNIDISEWSKLLIISLIFGIPVLLVHMSMSFYDGAMEYFMMDGACHGSITLGQLVMAVLNTPLQLLVGYRFYKAAVVGAMNSSYGMDFLVVTGTTITFVYSWFQFIYACQSNTASRHMFFETSGMLLMFVTIGKFLEAYARRHSVSALSSLLALQPRKATLVVENNGSMNDSRVVDIELIQKGDIVKIHPGERIPTDGLIVEGSSFVDESLITGESTPVQRVKGDYVYGSTINQKGLLFVKVISIGAESTLSQIIELVQNAQMNKAPIQAYADCVAGIFTPCVLLLASMTFFTWFFLSSTHRVPESWFEEAGYGQNPFLFSMLFSISVVVISCPCALGLATPTAIMVGTSVGASNGILIKGGPPFEVAHRVDTVVFDKTGTLTCGKPAVTDEIILADVDISDLLSSCGNDKQNCLLLLAAIAEFGSEHPLASAIVNLARNRKLTICEKDCIDFTVHQSGVQCKTNSGKIISVGSRSLMEKQQIAIGPKIDSTMWDLEVQGKTAVCVAYQGIIVGLFGIADRIKPEAPSAIQHLKSMGIDVWMVTGDNRTTAEAIADELNIPVDRIVAGALPADKVKKVEELQSSGKVVAMVGDGINDSPSIAKSDLGIAVGAGTHIAIDAADMVLVRSNLHDVVVALDLSKYVFNRIRHNLIWALLYNVLTIPFAAGIWFPWTHQIMPPQYAGLCMAFSSVSVLLSSLALKWYTRPQLNVQEQGDANETLIGKARSRMRSLKDSIQKRMASLSGMKSPYSALPTNEDEEFGLELGLGGLGGLQSNMLDTEFDDSLS